MSNYQDVFLSFQFHDDGFQSDDDVSVRFATSVAVIELVVVAIRKVFRICSLTKPEEI